MRPQCQILLVASASAWRAELLAGLQQTANEMPNPYGISFYASDCCDQALAQVKQNGLLQTLLIDATEDARAAELLVRECFALRPTIDLYLLVTEAQLEPSSIEAVVQDQHVLPSSLLREAIDGYFIHDEADPRGWFRILHAELHEKAKTPFFDALQNYVLMAKDAWHTPGHSSGDSIRRSPWGQDFHSFVGENVLRSDLSVSVDVLDSLLDPKGVIAQAQNEAAWAFGAKQTYFATNGTSTANKVILQTLLAPGDKLLLDRNCHKSVHHAVIISGAHPIYLDSSLNSKYGLFGPVPRARILAAIADNPDAKALILTSCTYDGLRYELKPLIDAAHAQGIKVIIDEAWYAHARFHPSLRPTALEAGADYATQSTHKMLSALSQASMIHVNDPDFDAHIFRENFNMHASTSPQYAIIASMDVARQQAVMEGYALVQKALEIAADLRTAINATGVFQVLDLAQLLPEEVRADGIQLDPTKVTVDISKSGFSADELQKLLFERFNIQVEKSTFNTITLLVTLGTTSSKLARLQDALLRIAKESKGPVAMPKAPELVGFTALKFLPRDAYYCDGEILPLSDNEQANQALVGRVSADSIVPYPPGIPALVPGQVITLDIVKFFLNLLHTHRRTDVHGLVVNGYLPGLRVMTLAEEQKHRSLIGH